MPSITLSMALKFDLPKKLSKSEARRIAKLVADVRYMQSLTARDVTADHHHLMDAADAMAALANVCRRAVASCPENRT